MAFLTKAEKPSTNQETPYVHYLKNAFRIIFLLSFMAASVLPAAAEKATADKKSDEKKAAVVKSEKS